MNSQKRRFWLTKILVFSILILSADFLFAQEPTLPCNGGDPDVDCPIDTGVILLVGTTVVFVVSKMRSLLTGNRQITDCKFEK